MSKPLKQEDSAGCAVACVASLCRVSYGKALSYFTKKGFASLRGYYCRDICRALSKSGRNFAYRKFSDKTAFLLERHGTIVFISSPAYPMGHYLLKTKKGWMNPWTNFPKMNPVKAGFQDKLPGKAEWVIFEE